MITTTTAPCAIAYTMPYFVGSTMAQVDAALRGNPATTEGLYRHYQIVPPVGATGPWTPNDRVAAQDPGPGACSETSLNSTLYLVQP